MRILTTLALTAALVGCTRTGGETGLEDTAIPQEVDSDGDGTPDDEDAFPDDPDETTDSDGDGVGDNGDAFPDDASETTDTDGDGTGDNADAFDDDPTETTDTDADGVGDNADAFDDDPTETTDTDADGVGDNADNCINADNADQADADEDGVGDVCEGDRDSDGVIDDEDAFPDDPNETVDTDGDGTGDNADAFDDDPTETTDSDGDGVGDNADAFDDDPTETTDSDGDGVGDNADAFDDDPTETTDTDGDGVGDNGDNCVTTANADQADLDGDDLGNACDTDRDGDGADNDVDAFPDDASETADSDSDGVGDNADAFPNDPSETKDSDLDGSGDNADCDDGDDAIYPGASEICDSVDNNCSGTIDDGVALGSAEACGAQSCLEIKTENSAASDGSYWLEPDGAQTPFEAYCDMTTDGGGYSYVKVFVPSAVGAVQAEEACDVLGMDLFVPRTEAHKNASLHLANNANIAVYRPADLSNITGEANLTYMYIMGIYPDESGVNLGYGGSACTNTPFNSLDGGCPNWNPNDGGPFFVSTRTNIAEPNGDNLDDASMYYSWVASGNNWEINHYNDIPNGGIGYTSQRFMCDVGDKWGDGIERE